MKFIVISILLSLSLFKTSNEDKQLELQHLNDQALEVTLNAFKQDAHCMAENIIYEAGNQGIRGGIAVAQITFNRANSRHFKNTICGVIYQKSQFSWVKLHKKPKYDNMQYREAWIIAVNVMQQKVILPELKDALYYHADYASPSWKDKMIKVAVIKNHIFYKERHERI